MKVSKSIYTARLQCLSDAPPSICTLIDGLSTHNASVKHAATKYTP